MLGTPARPGAIITGQTSSRTRSRSAHRSRKRPAKFRARRVSSGHIYAPNSRPMYFIEPELAQEPYFISFLEALHNRDKRLKPDQCTNYSYSSSIKDSDFKDDLNANRQTSTKTDSRNVSIKQHAPTESIGRSATKAATDSTPHFGATPEKQPRCATCKVLNSDINMCKGCFKYLLDCEEFVGKQRKTVGSARPVAAAMAECRRECGREACGGPTAAPISARYCVENTSPYPPFDSDMHYTGCAEERNETEYMDRYAAYPTQSMKDILKKRGDPDELPNNRQLLHLAHTREKQSMLDFSHQSKHRHNQGGELESRVSGQSIHEETKGFNTGLEPYREDLTGMSTGHTRDEGNTTQQTGTGATHTRTQRRPNEPHSRQPGTNTGGPLFSGNARERAKKNQSNTSQKGYPTQGPAKGVGFNTASRNAPSHLLRQIHPAPNNDVCDPSACHISSRSKTRFTAERETVPEHLEGNGWADGAATSRQLLVQYPTRTSSKALCGPEVSAGDWKYAYRTSENTLWRNPSMTQPHPYI